MSFWISEGKKNTIGDAKRNREHKREMESSSTQNTDTQRRKKKGGNMCEQKEKEEEEQKLSERTEVKDYS